MLDEKIKNYYELLNSVKNVNKKTNFPYNVISNPLLVFTNNRIKIKKINDKFFKEVKFESHKKHGGKPKRRNKKIIIYGS